MRGAGVIAALGICVGAVALAWGCGAGEGAGGRSTGEVGALRADTLRTLSYNIHHGEGMDSVVDLERIAALVRDLAPDLVALQEVDSVVERTNGVDQAAELARLTGMHPTFGRFMAYQGGAYGMAVLSRLPTRDERNLRLPEGAEPRSSVVVTVTLPSGRPLRFAGVHFYRTESERMAQAQVLESALSADPLPTVVAGDFNSTPGSAVMDSLALHWQVVAKGEDHLTFPSYGPEREIDFVLYRPAEAFRVLEQRVLDEPVMSDHRPVWTVLEVR